MKYILFLIMILNLKQLSASDISKHQRSYEYNKEDSIAIVKNISAFLQWYKSNYRKVYEYLLTYTDSMGYYQVDTKSCNLYLNYIKSSKLVSNEYIRLWKNYFESQAENFKTNKQNEGPPEGFDFDLVLHTQEPDEVFKSLEKIKYSIVDLSSDSANITVHTTWEDWKYAFELSKINGRWYIDYISLKEPE